MKTIKERIQFAYEGGLVERFHTRRGIKPSTDAAHSHGVAMLVWFLMEEEEETESSYSELTFMLMHALTHDLAEQSVSDVSAPLKWAIPEFGEQLDKLEKGVLDRFELSFVPTRKKAQDVVKLADALEGLLYCANERALGNRKVEVVADRWVVHVLKMAESGSFSDHQKDVIYNVVEIWRGVQRGERPADFTQYEVEERR
jgi:5'-deoxynucleotidase YfbR-like HD superfamily hydrolase